MNRSQVSSNDGKNGFRFFLNLKLDDVDKKGKRVVWHEEAEAVVLAWGKKHNYVESEKFPDIGPIRELNIALGVPMFCGEAYFCWIQLKVLDYLVRKLRIKTTRGKTKLVGLLVNKLILAGELTEFDEVNWKAKYVANDINRARAAQALLRPDCMKPQKSTPACPSYPNLSALGSISKEDPLRDEISPPEPSALDSAPPAAVDNVSTPAKATDFESAELQANLSKMVVSSLADVDNLHAPSLKYIPASAAPADQVDIARIRREPASKTKENPQVDTPVPNPKPLSDVTAEILKHKALVTKWETEQLKHHIAKMDAYFSLLEKNVTPTQAINV